MLLVRKHELQPHVIPRLEQDRTIVSGSAALAESEKTRTVDAILVKHGKVDSKALTLSPHLRVIAKYGSGLENMGIESATFHSIPVLRASAANVQSVANLAIILSVGLVKDVDRMNATVETGAWPKKILRM